MRAGDALAAERRRMPWMAVEKEYEFEGPDGPATLLDLFDGRRQLVVYRAFYAPDVTTYPRSGGAYWRACVSCSFGADQVAHPAHLNARDTTLVYVSHEAPQGADPGPEGSPDGWELIPWYSITDDFEADFGVDEWHGHNFFVRDGEKIFRTYFTDAPWRRGAGHHVELSRQDRARPPGGVGGLAGGLPADPALRVVGLPRRLPPRLRDRPRRTCSAGGDPAVRDRSGRRARAGARVDQAARATPARAVSRPAQAWPLRSRDYAGPVRWRRAPGQTRTNPRRSGSGRRRADRGRRPSR